MKDSKREMRNFKLSLFILTIFLIIGLIIIVISLIKIGEKTDSEYVNYFDQRTLKYEVCFKENLIFEEKCSNKDYEFVTDIIDNINLNFEYIFSSSKKMNYIYSYDVTTELVANEKLKSKKTIYNKKGLILEKKEVVLKDTSNFIIKEKVAINYDKYNKVMQELKQEYAILFDSKLIVKLTVNIKSNNDSFDKDLIHKETMFIEIPLFEQMISLSSDYNNTKEDYVFSNDEELVKEKEKAKSTLIYVLVFEGVIIVLLTILINKRLYKKNKFKMDINKIMKEYDRYITIVDVIPTLDDKSVIGISSFKELLDAREWLNKPIMYYETSKKGWFLIVNDNDVYSFTINK